MADILYYLLKVSVGTTVFYITYHLLSVSSWKKFAVFIGNPVIHLQS